MTVGYTLLPPLTTIALQSARTNRSSPWSLGAALFYCPGRRGMTTLAQASAQQADGWMCGHHRGGRSEGHQGLHGVNSRHLYLSKTSSLLSQLPFLSLGGQQPRGYLVKLLTKPSPVLQSA